MAYHHTHKVTVRNIIHEIFYGKFKCLVLQIWLSHNIVVSVNLIIGYYTDFTTHHKGTVINHMYM